MLEKASKQKFKCDPLKKINLEPNIASHTKINIKWIVDLNVKHETVILLERQIKKSLLILRLGKMFLDLTSKAQSI